MTDRSSNGATRKVRRSLRDEHESDVSEIHVSGKSEKRGQALMPYPLTQIIGSTLATFDWRHNGNVLLHFWWERLLVRRAPSALHATAPAAV